jgi:cholest-4-en-3-one 26-monooxygenase
MAIRLDDPALYERGFPHEEFDRLRKSEPVFFNAGPHHFYAVTRHDDAVTVLKDPQTYSSHMGGVSIEDPSPELWPVLSAMLPSLDPPEHMQLRRKLFPPLKAGEIARLEQTLQSGSEALLEGAIGQETFDFVDRIAARIPMDAFGALMGLGPDEIEPMRQCTDAVISQGANQSERAIFDMFELLDRLVADRRTSPRDDYLTLLATVDSGHEPMTAIARNGMLLQIIIGAIETTRNTLTGMLLALQNFPQQYELLRRHVELIPAAVEESLRYVSPVNYLRRTTRVAAELHGHALEQGSRVVVFLAAANRDPRQFPSPHQFDLLRENASSHLAFGAGEHFCMGTALARLEMTTFWRSFMMLVGDFEICGEPIRVRSVQQNAIVRLPVVLHAGSRQRRHST